MQVSIKRCPLPVNGEISVLVQSGDRRSIQVSSLRSSQADWRALRAPVACPMAERLQPVPMRQHGPNWPSGRLLEGCLMVGCRWQEPSAQRLSAAPGADARQASPGQAREREWSRPRTACGFVAKERDAFLTLDQFKQ